MQMLFTLDSLSNYISVYGKNSKFERTIKPNEAKNSKDLIIINFAVSEKTLRVS